MISTHMDDAPAPWSADELAAAFGCDRSNGRRKVIRLAERLETLLRALNALAGIDRPDRQARSALQLLQLGQQLYAEDPERMELWVRQIAEAVGKAG